MTSPTQEFASNSQEVTRSFTMSDDIARKILLQLARIQLQHVDQSDLVQMEKQTKRKVEEIFDDISLQRNNGFLDVTFIVRGKNDTRESFFQSPGTSDRPAGVVLDLTGMDIVASNTDSPMTAQDATTLLLELAQHFQENRQAVKICAGNMRRHVNKQLTKGASLA